VYGGHMKALVLAGGMGSRLRPISESIPKQLVPVANEPVIKYIIDDISRTGIEEVAIVVGDGEQISAYDRLGLEAEFGVDLSYVVQEEPKGPAHAVNCGREFVGDDPVLVYFGDTLVAPGETSRLVSQFDEDEHAAALALQRVSEPSEYGVAEFDTAGELVGVEEKPADPPSDLAYIGVVVFSPSVFETIGSQSPSERGELEITESINRLVGGETPVLYRETDSCWIDVGTPDGVVEANVSVLDGQLGGRVSEHANADADGDGGVVVGRGSSIDADAEIRGPVHIGTDTTVGPNAVVGPYTSIGNGCRVSNARVESCVLMDGVELTADVGIERSVIGPEAEIKRIVNDGLGRCVVGRGASLHLG